MGKNLYEHLINDVAGPMVDYGTHLYTALNEAKKYCYMNYGASYEEVLSLAGKTEYDLIKDAILRARNWFQDCHNI